MCYSKACLSSILTNNEIPFQPPIVTYKVYYTTEQTETGGDLDSHQLQQTHLG